MNEVDSWGQFVPKRSIVTQYRESSDSKAGDEDARYAAGKKKYFQLAK